MSEAPTTALDPYLEQREPDEPMFILLARDSAAPHTIDQWCEARASEIRAGTRPDTPGEREDIAAARAKAAEFLVWRKANR